MKVLYVCADRGIPLLGNKGASVHVRSVTSAMQRLGHRVTVATAAWGAGNEPPPVARLERLPPERSDAVRKLERLIAGARPDVVIERYSLQSGAARVASRRHGLPLTLEVNARLVEEAMRFRGLEDPGAREREQQTLREADRIQVVSPALLRHVREMAPHVPAAWIPNGADVCQLRTARPLAPACTRGGPVVGFVGSMKAWHGVEQLLDAFVEVRVRHPRATLVLAGSGPLEAALRERALRLGLREGVVFTGAVPHARVPALIAAFDAAVAPYAPLGDFYFHPLKIVEYMAAGKPVVYSRQGGLDELVASGGLGYEAGSTEDLGRRLTEVLDDPPLRARLAAAAAARGAEFDWSAIAARVLGFSAGAGCGASAGTGCRAEPAAVPR